MSTYNYRKIYQTHYGKIPKDSQGRSYEIHHIDGNRNNNEISNLKCVSIQEHYDIHFEQADWGACIKISKRMNISPEEHSELTRKHNLKRSKKGIHPWQNKELHKKINEKMLAENTHPFTNPDFIQKNKKTNSKRNKKLWEENNHPFQRKEVREKAIKNSIKSQKERIKNKTHHLQSGEIQRKSAYERLEKGTHPSQKEWVCEHCNKKGKSITNYIRWHGDKCKLKGD